MTAATRFWLRLTLGTAFAVGCGCAFAPQRPVTRLAWAPASALGACCGVLLFALLARAVPRPPSQERWTVLAGKLAVFGLWAANEEVLWRRVALGELLRLGVVPAVATSTVAFAALHRGRPALHLGTGGVFGVLYVSTGALAACVAAHWTYNVLVAALVEQRRA